VQRPVYRDQVAVAATEPTHPTSVLDQFDTGRLAVLGHKLLGSVSVVAGAVETLRSDGVSVYNRARLQAAIDRNLVLVANTARSLIHGELE
jgi:hypothetical protein